MFSTCCRVNERPQPSTSQVNCGARIAADKRDPSVACSSSATVLRCRLRPCCRSNEARVRVTYTCQIFPPVTYQHKLSAIHGGGLKPGLVRICWPHGGLSQVVVMQTRNALMQFWIIHSSKLVTLACYSASRCSTGLSKNYHALEKLWASESPRHIVGCKRESVTIIPLRYISILSASVY